MEREPVITATATRSDGWWAVELPVNGRTQYTQGRTLAEAKAMAQDLLSIWADELDSEELRDATVVLEVVGEERALAEQVAKAQAAVDESARAARATQKDAVAAMRKLGLTMQDIADLMGVTKGRVSQLANS
ncbi:hypothetical protein [Scrofimicrobium sp. R131]|uniref:Transcriptional regulator n=1 Tax=Scrofimicrobium appendicitidis TaxID=3079930 RepID=A0AAU7V7G0_9ACTO